MPSSSSSSSATTPSPPSTPSSSASKEHAFYCFDVLSSHFSRTPSPPPLFENPLAEQAIFVTWEVLKEGKEPRLRGCIGNFARSPVGEGLKEYALISAIRDTRFSPIKAKDLPTLGCGISLLTPFEPCLDPLDWTIGTHGIYITFHNPSQPNRTLTATYLPQIASEQGWSKIETLKSAIHKAGFSGDLNEIWDADASSAVVNLKVQRYRSEKAVCSWEEWRVARGGGGGAA
ncbi:AMMECR1 domain-containing protein [Mrakia frigida]|uniref:uncharacterized protein n=1 Tax=Mrakia frigida TaxID=29902 RepID=UPI003FCC083C